MKRIAQIGKGPWGQVYLNTFKDFPVDVKVCGRDGWQRLIDERPDGVVICTPPETHIEIASYAIDRNIPVMIEKPLSLSPLEAKQLSKATVPVVVNHTVLFTDALSTMRELISGGFISKLKINISNDGPIRSYSSLWDYGPHAVALALAFIGKMPNAVKNKRIYVREDNKTIYAIRLIFDDVTALCYVGNGAHAKHCNYIVSVDGLNLSYDDLKRPPSHNKPVNNAIQVFLDAIDGKSDWRVGLDLAIKTVEILKLCDKLVYY